jgi:hypothetical protein
MTRRSHRHLGPALVAFVVLFIFLSLARSVDVPRTGYGVKSDEATYVAMALSLAYDGDLTYEKWISNGSRACITAARTAFLKRGKHLRLGLEAVPVRA